ncbi:MAG: histidine phosphatase family protein [Anaerolineales bacterium]
MAENCMNYRFTFLRHGESTGNQQRVVQGQQDFPLSKTGLDQTEKLAAYWKSKGKQFDKIISSPLSRAKLTAQIIQHHIHAPLTEDPLWLERHAGELEGQPYQSAKKEPRFPRIKHLYEPTGKSGESDWELYLRAGEAVQALFLNPPGEYLIVSHGGILRQALTIISGAKPEIDNGGFHFMLHNTAYAILDFDLDRFRWHFHTLVQPQVPTQIENAPKDALWFIFLRHGESEGNANNIFQGQMETPLTAHGEAQANAMSDYFLKYQSHYEINSIFTSPQGRTVQTANPIAKKLNLKIQFSDLLKEVHYGKLQGLSWDEIAQSSPNRPDLKNPYLHIGEDGESWFELYLRGGKIIKMLTAHPKGNYLVVSHGSILNAMLWSLLGLVPQPGRNGTSFQFPNTGFAELVFSPSYRTWWFWNMASLDLIES